MIIGTLIGIIGIICVTSVIYILYIKHIKNLKEEIASLNSQLKSQQVRFGKSFEHFVPFMKKFPADRERTQFLGMPIDYISFDKDSIKFIEVKTGNSKLSGKQKMIKKQIESGKVKFIELRY